MSLLLGALPRTHCRNANSYLRFCSCGTWPKTPDGIKSWRERTPSPLGLYWLLKSANTSPTKDNSCRHLSPFISYLLPSHLSNLFHLDLWSQTAKIAFSALAGTVLTTLPFWWIELPCSVQHWELRVSVRVLQGVHPDPQTHLLLWEMSGGEEEDEVRGHFVLFWSCLRKEKARAHVFHAHLQQKLQNNRNKLKRKCSGTPSLGASSVHRMRGGLEK